MTAHPTIFVSIAAYRDPECQHTVIDLFEKARHPERIFIGICWQLDPEGDRDCTLMPPPYPKQVREKRYDAKDSKGGCWARAEALSLLAGEDYVMQIDAHMRVVQDWDELMIDTLARCPSKKAMLSTMPPAYTPPRKLQECTNGLPVTVVEKLAKAGDLQPVSLGGRIRATENLRHQGPLPGAFIIGNFLFGPSAAFREVPFDPHIYFRGQELTYSARLWTHGWDVWQPDRIVIYHFWGSKSRGKSAADYKSINETALRARSRVWHVLELEKAKDPAALIDLEKYGMGKARPLADFWEFAGIDLRRGVIDKKAKEGRWTAYLPPIKGYSVQFKKDGS